MKRYFQAFFFLFIAVFFLFTQGCGGGKGNSSPAAPIPTTDLSGTITLPTTVNPLLLPSVRASQNTDSDVRAAFSASSSVWVNDTQTTNRLISPTSANPTWDFRILGVPQSSTGFYKIHLVVGKLALKSWVKTSQKDAFTVNSQTTAAALLAEASKINADSLTATFPAMVSKVALQVESAFNASSTMVKGTILSLPELTNEVASQADFLTKTKDYDSNSLVAYLGTSNDLDGNGIPDVKISQTVDRTGIRIETTISSSTSLMENLAGLASYTDAALLDDFKKGFTRTDRTFDSTAKNVGLGLYFSKGAGGDKYLKMIVKRVDLSQGTFSGVFAQYSFVSASSTAIATGTKTFRLKGAKTTAGTVEASDFITDTTATASGYLAFLDADRGLGNTDGVTRIVRSIDGQPDLSKLSSAEPFSEAGTTYSLNTASALKVINKTRGLEAGDVFSAYFKVSRHYVLFKIKAVDAQSVTVDYISNLATDEPVF